MKDLQASPYDMEEAYTSGLNKEHLLKYMIMFGVVTAATLVIPTCGVLRKQAAAVGLLAATTFVVLDMSYPKRVVIDSFHS
jgi:hypothetical protein